MRLDVKSVSHTNDESSITYTVDTYEDFADQDLDFRWAIDRTGDGRVDMFVSSQWEDSEQALVASVEDDQENALGKATISRPAPNAVQVSFSRAVLKEAASYAYSVRALTDLNGNGEADKGEVDLAPDAGWYHHDLAAAPMPPSSTRAEPPGTPPAPPAQAPAPEASSPPPSPAPESSAGPAPQSLTAAPAPPPTPAPRPSPVPVAGRQAEARAQHPAPESPAGAVPTAGESAALSATGAGNLWLVLVAVTLIVVGIPCRTLGRHARPGAPVTGRRGVDGATQLRIQPAKTEPVEGTSLIRLPIDPEGD